MSRLQDVNRTLEAMETINSLTGAFEGIASLQLGRIKNQVLQSKQFFGELWRIYQQINVASLFSYGRRIEQQVVNEKELFVVITAEGGFSGEIDEKLIDWMLKNYNPQKNDLIVIGHHGAVQLAQRGVSFRKYYKLPERNQNINVEPVIKEVQQYRSTIVYYQTYVSLTVQDIKRISLSSALAEEGKTVSKGTDVINETTYIFEPSTYAVVDHLERSMLNIMLSQVILESKLAQYASRFRAMSSAHEKAGEQTDELRTVFNRAKRARKDERLKEIVNGLRKVSV